MNIAIFIFINSPLNQAIAIVYNETCFGPVIVAKEIFEKAVQLKNIAVKNGIECIEENNLTQSLFENSQVDDFIPDEFYLTIANIIADIFKTQKTVTQIPQELSPLLSIDTWRAFQMQPSCELV
jgi:flagellar biosynthetic protein FlhB